MDALVLPSHLIAQREAVGRAADTLRRRLVNGQ